MSKIPIINRIKTENEILPTALKSLTKVLPSCSNMGIINNPAFLRARRCWQWQRWCAPSEIGGNLKDPGPGRPSCPQLMGHLPTENCGNPRSFGSLESKGKNALTQMLLYIFFDPTLTQYFSKTLWDNILKFGQVLTEVFANWLNLFPLHFKYFC